MFNPRGVDKHGNLLDQSITSDRIVLIAVAIKERDGETSVSVTDVVDYKNADFGTLQQYHETHLILAIFIDDVLRLH